MSTLVQLVRRHPVSAFFVLACFFGWLPYLCTFLGLGSNPENLPFGPVLATLVVTSCQGRAALFAWGRTLRRWAASPWLYAVALGAPLAIDLTIVAVNHLFGAPLPTLTQLGDWPEVPVTFAMMLVFVGLGEEAGWTAFAAPVLLRRHGLLGAFALLAGMRILWHLPLMLAGDMPFVMGILGNAGFQLVLLLLLRRSGGAWSLAAVWHATLNALGNAFFFSMVTGADRDRLSLFLGIAYAVVGLAALLPGLLGGRSRRDDLDARALRRLAERDERRGRVAEVEDAVDEPARV